MVKLGVAPPLGRTPDDVLERCADCLGSTGTESLHVVANTGPEWMSLLRIEAEQGAKLMALMRADRIGLREDQREGAIEGLIELLLLASLASLF